MRWLFLVRGAGDFETNRHRQFLLERRDVTMSGPQLQLCVAVGAQPRQVVVAARKQIDAGKRLRVTAVKSFSQSDDGRQHPDRRAKRAAQISVAFV